MAEKFVRGNEWLDEALEDPIMNQKVQDVRAGNRTLDEAFKKTSE